MFQGWTTTGPPVPCSLNIHSITAIQSLVVIIRFVFKFVQVGRTVSLHYNVSNMEQYQVLMGDPLKTLCLVLQP